MQLDWLYKILYKIIAIPIGLFFGLWLTWFIIANNQTVSLYLNIFRFDESAVLFPTLSVPVWALILISLILGGGIGAFYQWYVHIHYREEHQTLQKKNQSLQGEIDQLKDKVMKSVGNS